ncbi:MAG: SpoIIE family protein phosphatase [Bacteroidetes bacterium]|nr:SpoIIE family protein phosphatase [Bacteroidota bacterium]
MLEIKEQPVRIGASFSFYEDKSGNQSVRDVEKCNDFSYPYTDIPNFNISSNAIWGKIKFTCYQQADWYLSIDPASFNEIVVYQKKGKGEWKEEHLGNLLKQRPLPVNHYFFKLDLNKGDTVQLYFRVQDYYPLQFDIKAGTLESFVGPMHDSDLFNGICYGIMIMMLIYNFYLYVTQKKIVYLYYVLYIFFSMIFTAILGGYALHIAKWFFSIIEFAPIIPPACFGIFGLLFTLKLFGEALSKRFRKVVHVFIFIAIGNIILSTTPLVYLSETIIQPLGLLLGILCISAAIIALKKKHSSAIFYLIGFGAYMLSLFYLILSAQAIFTINDFTWHALATGSAIESIMLSFALGDKLKVSLLEKEKAQEDALKQATENERLVREQNVHLEYKVKERTIELEEKNKEVLDSIHYAKRIQNTLLAHENFLQANLEEHFVFFKPKDIVSGDFYWATSADSQLFYLAVCDSTGHGVPGAFMSLLNISFLNEAITEKKLTEPGQIFDHVRKRLIENVSQDGGRDGMDAILCCFECDSNSGREITRLRYAAANNEPVLIRGNEVICLDKDKMPVGVGEKKDAFSSFSIEVKKGDCLYLFTDGYADQFGGPKGKKFKHRKLEEKLLEISGQPMRTQSELLESAFNEWRGGLEQIDDVLVVGIRI